jgi:hypothetical protein
MHVMFPFAPVPIFVLNDVFGVPVSVRPTILPREILLNNVKFPARKYLLLLSKTAEVTSALAPAPRLLLKVVFNPPNGEPDRSPATLPTETLLNDVNDTDVSLLSAISRLLSDNNFWFYPFQGWLSDSDKYEELCKNIGCYEVIPDDENVKLYFDID